MKSVHSPVDFPVLFLIGPTAIGKTKLSIELAKQFGCEIISMDSMQVYRHMDIGTAKILPQEMGNIPHHLIDVVDPDEEYNAGRYVKDTFETLKLIHKKGKTPLITGGTGLYFRSLTEGLAEDIVTDTGLRESLKKRLKSEGPKQLFAELQQCDSATAARIHENDHYRLVRALEIFHSTGVAWSEHLRRQQLENRQRFSALLVIGLTCERKALYDRINKRTLLMKEQGLEQEVQMLMEMGFRPDLKPMKSIGYRHMVHYIQGRWGEAETFQLLARDTRHYAKRQYTWFNHSHLVNWFKVTQHADIIKHISKWLSKSIG